MNRFAAALSTASDLEEAIAQVAAEAKAALRERPSLAVVFASHEHARGFADLARDVRRACGADRLIGCGGESIVGGAREIDDQPSLSLWLASFPEGEVETFRLDVDVKDDAIHLHGFPGIEKGVETAKARVSMLLLCDPYSFPADLFLRQMNESLPGIPICGGMASGGSGPGGNALFIDDDLVREGAIGAILRGVPLRSVVSQGCRPVGPAMVITRAKENVIEELAGKRPLDQLQRVFTEAGAEDKELLKRAFQEGGLNIGQVVDELRSNPSRGDFLVRSVMGADQETGALRIGDQARRGRTIRFHVRDARTADEDLRELLDGARRGAAPAGALLFTCNGRGTRMFEQPDHDASCVQKHAGPVPAAGFFAAGEIGTIGGRSFLHGFTASVALFDAE